MTAMVAVIKFKFYYEVTNNGKEDPRFLTVDQNHGKLPYTISMNQDY